MRPLNGADAVVTGAANGIGRALALRLAREGAALALADREAERQGYASHRGRLQRRGGGIPAGYVSRFRPLKAAVL